MQNIKKKIIQGYNSFLGKSATAFLLKVLSAGLSFAYNVVLANIVGAEGAGKYYLAFVILGCGRILSLLGMRNVVLRFSATAHNQNDLISFQSIIYRALLYVGIAGILITTVIFFGAEFLTTTFFENADFVLPIRLMILAVTPTALLLICSEIFKAIDAFKLSLIFEGISIPFFGLIFMPILATQLGAIGAILSFSIVSWGVFILAYLKLKSTINKEFTIDSIKQKTTNVSTKAMFDIGYSLLLVELFAYWIGNGDAIIIGAFIKDAKIVGIYTVSQRLATLVSFILISVNTIVAPQFSKYYSSGEHESLKKVATQSTKTLILVATPVLFLYLMFPTFLLGFFGSEFKENGSVILSILAIGQFINVITGSVGYLLIMCGAEKIMRNIIIFSVFITVATQLMLIPRYSIIGVAIGASLGLSLQNLLATFFVHKKLNISVF